MKARWTADRMAALREHWHWAVRYQRPERHRVEAALAYLRTRYCRP